MTTRRPLARALVAALALVAATLAGCSDDDGAAPADTTAPDGTEATAPAEAPEPEVFTGDLDDFYVVPDPLPPGRPGDLIRVMEVDEADDTRTVRVMYLSRDAQERDRAVTGLVTHPTADASDGGWPVVSWSHGTTGLASPCAPSRGDGPAPGFGVEGVHVATDYIGLGPVGELHPYLSKPGEGRAAIDIVRAARQLPDAGAGDRWLSVGHSQGGHGALSAHELAADHAPELELLGTVAYAPAAVFDETFGPLDEVVSGIVGFMGLYGAAAEHPEIDLDDHLTPEAAAAAPVIEEGCLDDIVPALLAVGVDGFYATHPLEVEPARSILLANDVAAVAVDAPVLLVSGTDDDRVVIERALALDERLCAVGQVTELVVVEGAGHDDVIDLTADRVGAWLRARLDGEDPTDTCTEES